MKSIIFRFLLVLAGLMAIVSCVKTDDYELPKLETPELNLDEEIITIAAVKGHFNEETGEIYTFQNTTGVMEGYVISSDEGGNFYKELILQDSPVNPTAGIQILIDDNALFSTFEFGRKIFVNLNGLSLGYNNGVLQLGIQNRGDVVAIPRSLIDNHIIRSMETVDIEPLKLEIRDFEENHKNLYVRLDNVQFSRDLIRDERRYTFAAETNDEFDGIRQLESCETGATTMLTTSTFADFRSLLLPQSSGAIEGVLTRDFYDDFYTIVLNTPEGLHFEESERCDPQYLHCGANTTPGNDVIFQESFETITTLRMLETRDWLNVNTTGGSEVFKPGTLGGNRHVRISAYNTIEGPLEAWLVTPSIDLKNFTNEVLSFDVRASFDNATILWVYVTENYTGNPLITSWTLIDAKIPVGPSNQNAVNFTRSHIDISCLEGVINVAFRYQGSASEKTTTYDIDNIRVTGN